MAIQFLNTVQVDTSVLYANAANDRVGINTQSPGGELQVVGSGSIGNIYISANAAGSSVTDSLHIKKEALKASIINRDGGDLALGANNNEYVTIKGTSNVGIGTTSPSTKLEISSSGVNGVDISESASNATQSGRLFFSTNTASEGFALFNSNGTLQINSGGIPNNTSGTNRISILSNGNVGVGTTSPDAKLHVFGTSEDNRGVGQGVTSVIEITNSYVTAFNRLSELIFSTSTGGGANRMSAISSAYTGQSGSNLSGDLRFSTRTVGDSALSEKIRIESDGNVGIGTASPDSKLHVYANNADAPTVVTIENGDTAVVAGQDLAKIEFLTNDVSAPGAGVAASIRAVCQNAGNIFDLAFNTQNGPTRTERMRLTGAGNLGLGTTSLTSISSTSRTLSLGSTSTTTSGGIAFQVNGVVKAYNYVTSDYLINQTVSGIGQIFYGAGSERMRIHKTTGNVGIGTTSPSDKLEVAAANSQLRLTDTDDNNFAQFSYSSGKLVVRNNSTTTTVNQFTLDSSGRVGIGTTSPSSKLHVLNTTASMPALGAAPSAAQFGNSSYGTLFSTLTSGRGVIQQGRSDSVALSFDLLLQPVGGNVGINKSSASYKLDVSGEGRFTGDLRCLSLIQTSQSDKKESIAGIVKTKAKTIEFKEYVYKSDGANRKRYGVLAEDIEDDYPELVHVDAEGVKGINYIDLLVKRVAELEKELEDISLTQGPKGDTGAAGADGNSHLKNISSMAINSKTGQLEIKIGKSTYKFNPDK